MSTSIKALLTVLLLSFLQAGWARPASIPEDCTAERLSGTWAGASFGGGVLAIVHLNQDGTASVNLWNDGYIRSENLFDREPTGVEERSETYSGKWRMLNRKGEVRLGISDIELDVLPSIHLSRVPGWAFDVNALCSVGRVELFKIELTSSNLDPSARIKIYLSRPRQVLEAHYHYERFLDALRVLR